MSGTPRRDPAMVVCGSGSPSSGNGRLRDLNCESPCISARMCAPPLDIDADDEQACTEGDLSQSRDREEWKYPVTDRRCEKMREAVHQVHRSLEHQKRSHETRKEALTEDECPEHEAESAEERQRDVVAIIEEPQREIRGLGTLRGRKRPESSCVCVEDHEWRIVGEKTHTLNGSANRGEQDHHDGRPAMHHLEQ